DHIPYDPLVYEVECSLANNCEFVKICKETNWSPFPVHIITTIGGRTTTGPAFRLNCAWLYSIVSDGRTYCIAKPVIYLYPQTPTKVQVSLKVPGEIYISDPLYPKGTGWQ